jgi:hypothetical protein
LERKRSLGRKRHNIIILDLKEEECENVDWTHLAQDGIKWWAIVSTEYAFNSIKARKFPDWLRPLPSQGGLCSKESIKIHQLQ